MCEDHNLSMPDRSWKMKVWDTFEGQYENNPITEHMVRGGGGAYPNKVEFMHGVIDALTENKNAGSAIFAMSRIPHTKEPGGLTSKKFEMFRGRDDRLVIEYHCDAKWTVVDDFGPKLDDVIDKAEDAGELDALAKLLEEKLQTIQMAKKRKKMDAVE